MRARAGTSVYGGLAVCIGVYLVAVFNRTTLGVAGLAAQDRFGISPGQLSAVILAQLAAYAVMQVPAGVLVDRLGPRRLLLTAALVMAAAQALFAVSPTYGGALVARGVLGAGDALTFVSVLRYASQYVPVRRYPAVVALTGALGQTGNILATVPLTLALRHAGWTPTFGVASAVSLTAFALVAALAPRDAFGGRVRGRSADQLRAGLARTARDVRRSWHVPGTRLGFWHHFCNTGQFAFVTVLWGQPYLVEALDLSKEDASAVLTGMVFVSLATQLPAGTTAFRRPGLRNPLGAGLAVLALLSWLALLLLGGSSPPVPLVVAVFFLTAMGGPVSSFGFSIARDHNDAAVMGTATGIVNVGGWLAGALACGLAGAVLDVRGTDPDDYRVAFLAALVVLSVGVSQLLRWWRRVVREDAAVP
jgi:MFS family permease